MFGVSQNYVFDMFVFVFFCSITTAGGTCVLLEGPLSLIELDDERLTHLKDVPTVISKARIPQSIRHVHVGGEALSQSVLANVSAHVVLTNDYGPTEASVNVAAKRVNRKHLAEKLGSIGCPFQNVTAYIIDPDTLALQPQGVPGELWLGGVQVARGYLNRPEKTAEVFIAPPWPETDPSGRGVVYRTGDRVRWYADGEIEFGGRIDFQVRAEPMATPCPVVFCLLYTSPSPRDS